MRSMYRLDGIFFAVSLTLGVLLLSGCSPEIRNRRNVVCLIDYSGTIKPETLDVYARAVVDDVMMNLGEYDKMVLMPIDEGSKIQAVQLISHDLSKEPFRKPEDNPLKAEDLKNERLKEKKMGFRDADLSTVRQQKELRKQFTGLTDILGAIDQAASLKDANVTPSFGTGLSDWVNGVPEFVSENVIVIASDMIHESSDLNFQRLTMDENTINKIIGDLKSKNKIPDLSGTKIFICGRTGKDNKMVEGIQNFWKKYFAEAHAELKVYDYDSSKMISDFMQSSVP